MIRGKHEQVIVVDAEAGAPVKKRTADPRADARPRDIARVIGAALVGGFGLATPAAAHASAGIIGAGSGRTGANVAAAVALLSVVIGGLALARSAGRIRAGNGRTWAIAALVLGLLGVALAGLHLATSTGGIGTGNGRGGAIVALVLGLISLVLGRLALARSHRTG